MLDACAPAENEKRQATAIDGNVAWSESELLILHEEVNEGTDKHTTVVGVVLLWCVCCAGDERPGGPVREWEALAFQVFVLQIAKDGLQVVVVVGVVPRIVGTNGVSGQMHTHKHPMRPVQIHWKEEITLAENVKEIGTMVPLRPVLDALELILSRVVKGSHEMRGETVAAEAALPDHRMTVVTAAQELGACINQLPIEPGVRTSRI